MSETVQKNSLRAWLLASRPKTLSGALVPVILSGALLWRNPDVPFSFALLLLCLAFAALMQIAANLINDLVDYLKGSDREDRLGPERACQMGWISPSAMKKGIAVCILLSSIAGLTMLFIAAGRMPYHGWELILTGAACFIFAFLYTTHMSYLGLGDLLVVIFFGLVPVVMTWYVQAGGVSPSSLVLGFLTGIMTDTLLLVNNIRDINEDRKSGKKTLVVRTGLKASRVLYLMAGIIPILLLIPLFILEGIAMWKALIPGLTYLALHLLTTRKLCRLSGKALNGVLKENSRNMLIMGILLALTLAFL